MWLKVHLLLSHIQELLKTILAENIKWYALEHRQFLLSLFF